MSPRLRWTLLLGALGAVALLAIFAPAPEDESPLIEAQSGNGTARSADDTQSAGEPEILALLPRSSTAATRKLFAPATWAPPPPKPTPPPAAPPPVAPPLPFTFVGKRREGADWEVFLGRGEQTLVVRQQQTIDNLYRIDEIKPPTMTVTYLPLGERQTLAIGAAE
jgi:hypothetical protein